MLLKSILTYASVALALVLVGVGCLLLTLVTPIAVNYDPTLALLALGLGGVFIMLFLVLTA